jgi:hypothetical protein
VGWFDKLPLIAIAACSAPAPVVERPVPPVAVVADAAPEAVIDAGPDPLLAMPAFVFRYTTADRAETWTLHRANGAALLVVESKQGTRTYRGTDTDGAIDVTSGTAKMNLSCKQTKRSLSTKCNDTKAKPVDVLDCFHPAFATPMPFAAAPGVEYVVDASCNGYRLVAP